MLWRFESVRARFSRQLLQVQLAVALGAQDDPLGDFRERFVRDQLARNFL